MTRVITEKAEFKGRVRGWAEKLGARVTSISVRPMSRKWGSYSTTGRLTFDASILELREGLQDYVIAHELLHFHAPNHGKLWKSLMRVHLGEYEQLEGELRRIARNKLMQADTFPSPLRAKLLEKRTSEATCESRNQMATKEV